MIFKISRLSLINVWQVSCEKKPHSKTLLKHWGDNYPAMLALLTAADSGVKGLTVDEEGNTVSGVRISVR